MTTRDDADARWWRYLFEAHPEATLRAWARRLRLFRFFRAFGGHAGDGDALLAAFRYATVDELLGFFAFAGLPPAIHATKPAQPVPGTAYPHEEFAAFASLIPGTQWIEQPGHCRIAGRPAFVWCDRDRIRISLHTGWDVTEANVVDAEALEVLLAAAPLPRIEPPVDHRNCVCPKYYPDWFPEPTP